MIVMETPPTKRAPISSRWLAWSLAGCSSLLSSLITNQKKVS